MESLDNKEKTIFAIVVVIGFFVFMYFHRKTSDVATTGDLTGNTLTPDTYPNAGTQVSPSSFDIASGPSYLTYNIAPFNPNPDTPQPVNETGGKEGCHCESDIACAGTGYMPSRIPQFVIDKQVSMVRPWGGTFTGSPPPAESPLPWVFPEEVYAQNVAAGF